MAEFLQQLTFWHWLIAGIVFIVLETLLPGLIFLWVGFAAIATGLILVVFADFSWQVQFLAFAVLSVISVAGGRHWIKKRPIKSDLPLLNRRGEQLVGKLFTLDDPIIDGKGRMRIGDGAWKVQGPDLPAATRVKVTGIDGTTLIVEKTDPSDAGE